MSMGEEVYNGAHVSAPKDRDFVIDSVVENDCIAR